MRKSVILFLGLFAFIALCAAIRFFDYKYISSYANNNSSEDGTLINKNTTIVDRNILLGKWDFEIRTDSYKEINIIKGTAIYNNSNQYIKRITYKKYIDYYGKAEDTQGSERVLAGGTVNGNWGTTNIEFWEEDLSDCDIKASVNTTDQKNFCTIFDDYSRFGNVITNTKNFEIKSFTTDKILIEGEDLSSEGKITITYIRKN
ncbi:hypothetical protein LX87_05596 [Larkinella arboricola]|uniref:Uncharacterized protein n=1 Tax=Larkinella arboricola TaxID=643671 RepID=A0A327WNS6_LARAB|nr:hypothetical protein [Larkinella arboricola]RAJ89907.1 hypothetical protein LX87_05596 [Larkinella arboricola]